MSTRLAPEDKHNYPIWAAACQLWRQYVPDESKCKGSMWLVYFIFDRDGQLLYIGKSGFLFKRLHDHGKGKAWAYQMAELATLSCPDEITALALERECFLTLEPLYNNTMSANEMRFMRRPDDADYVTLPEAGKQLGKTPSSVERMNRKHGLPLLDKPEWPQRFVHLPSLVAAQEKVQEDQRKRNEESKNKRRQMMIARELEEQEVRRAILEAANDPEVSKAKLKAKAEEAAAQARASAQARTEEMRLRRQHRGEDKAQARAAYEAAQSAYRARPDGCLTKQETAAMFGKTVATIESWIASGTLAQVEGPDLVIDGVVRSTYRKKWVCGASVERLKARGFTGHKAGAGPQILRALQELAGEKTEVTVSHARLAAMTCLYEETVKSNLRRLEAMGSVAIVAMGPEGKTIRINSKVGTRTA